MPTYFATQLWFSADGVERASLVSLIALSGFDPDRPHLALTESEATGLPTAPKSASSVPCFDGRRAIAKG